MSQPLLMPFKLADLDETSLALVREYGLMRLGQGFAKATVASEQSQLRSLLRDSLAQGGPKSLEALMADLPATARLLAAPDRPCHASTIQTRLRAFQRLLGLGVAEQKHRQRLEVLDEHLPTRRTSEWHQAGILLGGHPAPSRKRFPSLDPGDLERIIQESIQQSAEAGALAGALCFSGLAADEVRTLRWSQVRWQGAAESWEVSLQRRKRRHRLLIIGPGAQALTAWRLDPMGVDSDLIVPGKTGKDPLSPRGFRKRVKRILKAAGYPSYPRSTFVSACAAWLSEKGFTDHEVKVLLGRRRVKTIDGLLAPHRRLAAQRRVMKAWQEG